MLVLNNINKSFKNIEVLKNISFTVKENKIFAFLGPNGVGKTTLIKIISGLISADSGTVLLDDKKISMDKISTMFDGSRNLYWNISVRENFYYFTALKGRFKKEVDYLLEKNKEIFVNGDYEFEIRSESREDVEKFIKNYVDYKIGSDNEEVFKIERKAVLRRLKRDVRFRLENSRRY